MRQYQQIQLLVLFKAVACKKRLFGYMFCSLLFAFDCFPFVYIVAKTTTIAMTQMILI